MAEFLVRAWAPATQTQYIGALGRFLTWTAAENIDFHSLALELAWGDVLRGPRSLGLRLRLAKTGPNQEALIENLSPAEFVLMMKPETSTANALVCRTTCSTFRLWLRASWVAIGCDLDPSSLVLVRDLAAYSRFRVHDWSLACLGGCARSSFSSRAFVKARVASMVCTTRLSCLSENDPCTKSGLCSHGACNEPCPAEILYALICHDQGRP